MAIAWTKDLETGVENIDNQHKELFVRIDNLLEACRNGVGMTEVNRTLDFLMRYVVQHFEAEEAVMRSTLYPGYDAHRRMHADFRAQVEKMAHEIRAEGFGPSAVVKVNLTIVGWLNDHIRRFDLAMAKALREQFASIAI